MEAFDLNLMQKSEVFTRKMIHVFDVKLFPYELRTVVRSAGARRQVLCGDCESLSFSIFRLCSFNVLKMADKCGGGNTVSLKAATESVPWYA